MLIIDEGLLRRIDEFHDLKEEWEEQCEELRCRDGSGEHPVLASVPRVLHIPLAE